MEKETRLLGTVCMCIIQKADLSHFPSVTRVHRHWAFLLSGQWRAHPSFPHCVMAGFIYKQDKKQGRKKTTVGISSKM